MARLLLLYLSFGYSAVHSRTCMSAQFTKPGDYTLGGLFPLTMNIMNLSNRVEPTVVVCERLYTTGLIWALGMKFAIEKINNSTSLLPGIELGYDIHDTCLEPVVTIQSSLLFLTQKGSTGIKVLCNYTDYQTQVTAVIGPYVSDLALITAKLFGFFLLPQVSYGATSEKLSQEDYYPSFFRTVPSDMKQSEALVQLLDKFDWNWIAALGSEDEYGREGLSSFSTLATEQGICIAYEALIPADPSAQDLRKLEKIIKNINETQVNVIVLFSVDRPVKALLELWLSHGLSPKVWVATEAWAMSDIVTAIPNIHTIGTVIGFTIKGGHVPGFQDYVTDLFASVQQKSFCQAAQQPSNDTDAAVLGPQCEQCNDVSLQNVSHLLEHQQVYTVYVAVYSMAHALHQALGCMERACPKVTIKSWQLLEVMKTLQFTLDNQSFQMDGCHSMNHGYDVVVWSRQPGGLQYIPVGDYWESLQLNTAQIRFHTVDNQKPVSTCFQHCESGQIKRVKGFHLCCYDCIDCGENTYQSAKEALFCSACPEHQWSPVRSTQCYDRSERYLFWDEPLIIGLLVLMVFIMVLTILVTGLFIKHLNTPMVQASGGSRSIFALISLLLMCLSLCLHIGKPTTVSCSIQQPFYALCLCGCFSTFLVKSLEIVLLTEFKSSPESFLLWLTQKRAWLVIALVCLTESLLCFWYVYAVPSRPGNNYKLLNSQVLIQCNIQSWFAFILIHSYNGGLAFVCFLCTFMVQTPAKKYNVARGITFSMLAFFVTWIIFVTTYSTVEPVQQPAAQIFGVLLCTLGVLASYYIPKCYIILFKPEWNTVAYFQNYAKEGPHEEDSRKPDLFCAAGN
ncbi:taste receptor type 1 member 3 [Carettochelys insculpta]|uniref:taste receptor type 1 member 3 n=1 Tax=Carettochelys insculpta TaxID=44489 RepID=UPI003EB6FE9D